MAKKKKHRKMTPEERARQEANRRYLEEALQRGLERDGLTREEVFRRAGFADPRKRAG